MISKATHLEYTIMYLLNCSVLFFLVLTWSNVDAAQIVPPSTVPNVCPKGSPLANYYCGRGGTRCPRGYYCEIAPDDTYAVCCRMYHLLSILY